MAQTIFSERLSMLMKTRKISGQKIADILGVSQKTISRYANGEVEPNTETKDRIFKIISDISGFEEDAMTENEIIWNDLWQNNEWGEGELELARAAAEECKEKYCYYIDEFKKLTRGARTYYISHFTDFHKIASWEYKALNLYRNLKPSKQNELMSFLNNLNMSFEILLQSNIAQVIRYIA